MERDLKLAGDAESCRAFNLIASALSDVIEPFPFLRCAVSELVWRCHIVLAETKDCDVSFSDPAVPFSIFVSAPPEGADSSILRVAESVIHETMHLQLTLFESLVPLVDIASLFSMYSPWKQENRPAQGVLHGLYVFSVLRWMWLRKSQTTGNRIDRDFASRRVAEIDEQVSAVRSLEKSPALTEAGRRLLDQLFIVNDAEPS
ncbi:MAG TPA: HEXXH motif-containing putative peptide modification protein [Candidatus Acidoferrales bacterium]|nr:HEXXH motif-containing putative peptide modification protein [Candidatus Acidoferrales bacterium]